ncbi:hypothetical protein HMN09_01209400 [Mycena chlorophos]|uniref:Uncharacterized protein n=1 Tax=Mycena chlorophos TaxID=658473 RepID=A0A8H6S6I5_MYCCL|nr:hypothetical protein HMN09_01209400 [Mycena chlorophos]
MDPVAIVQGLANFVGLSSSGRGTANMAADDSTVQPGAVPRSVATRSSRSRREASARVDSPEAQRDAHDDVAEGPSPMATEQSSEVSHLRKEVLEQQTTIRDLQVKVTKLNAELELARTAGETKAEGRAACNRASTADVIRKLESLHDEIFQIAAVLSDSDTYPRPSASISSSVVLQHGQYLHHLVGGDVAGHILHTQPDKIPDIAVQFLVQTAIVSWCTPVINSWTGGVGGGSLDRVFDDLLAEAQRTDERRQDVSLWRAMTRKHAETVFAPSKRNVGGPLFSSITTILLLVNDTMNQGAVYAAVGDRLAAVVAAALDLNHAIGAEIVSDALEVFSVRPGGKFVPTFMQSIAEDGKDAEHAGEAVICSTGLGLVKTETRRTMHDVLRVPLLRAKVLLQSELQELLE